MCIFAQPVKTVTDTKIFARLLPDGWQALVYQMNFESNAKNAIILPLPVQLPSRDEDSLQFISFQENATFFDDLNRLFPITLPTPPLSRKSVDTAADSPRLDLKVHEVGEFVASFVPTISDFDRLDKQFRIPSESWDKIPVYSDYGFAVFQLKSLAGKPHPMAFKFKSRLSGDGSESLFFPTVHIHDGEVHKREKFDHTLYLQSSEFDSACGQYVQRGYSVEDDATGYVRSKWAAVRHCDPVRSKGILNPQGLVHRREMRGVLDNTDVIVDIGSINKQARFSPAGRGSMTALAALCGVTGMKWFFDRRERVAEHQVDSE